MTTSTEKRSIEMLEALAHLRQAVTEEGIELLRSERFADAQVLTQIGQELKDLELRLGSILRSNAVPTSPAPAVEGRTERLFPRYVRRGESLVKIGQRRDRRGTYEQKIAKTEFDEIAHALQQLADERSEFEAGDVIKAVNCPAYQVYLVLGYLQETGHLDSPARGHYRLRADKAGQIAEAWQQAGGRG